MNLHKIEKRNKRVKAKAFLASKFKYLITQKSVGTFYILDLEYSNTNSKNFCLSCFTLLKTKKYFFLLGNSHPPCDYCALKSTVSKLIMLQK